MSANAPDSGITDGRGHRRQLIDLAFDAMFVRTFKERAITYWNDGAERLYGWTRLEAIGRQPAELLGSQYPIPLEQIEQHLEREGRWDGEILQRRKDGHAITVLARWGLQTDADGRPQAILEINSDISQERRAAEELSRSEQRFALLVSAVVDYGIFMLAPDGTVVSWNEGAQRIKGYSDDEIIGQNFSVFYPPEDIATGKPSLVLAKATQLGRYEDEGWRMRKDGSRFWASVVVTALRDGAGTLQGFAKVTRDITERREAEQSRNAEHDRQADELREEANRMAELERMKTEFLNLASHELRGPLAVVRGYNWMLRDGVVQSEELPAISRIVEGKLVQINLLVEQMLEAARLEAGRMDLNHTTIDLVEVVSEQAKSFGSFADSHAIKVTAPGRPILVSADRHRIEIVVTNLIDNAIKYSPDADEVDVAVGEKDGCAFVAVRDFGVGVATENLPLLFQRFSRLPTEQNITTAGTGLGLFLCQEIANRHGGAIEVESAPGEGSTFTLRLPALTAKATRLKASSRRRSTKRGPGLNTVVRSAVG